MESWGPKPFRFELMCLEEKGIADLIQSWWSDFQIQGWAGYRLACKLKHLKNKIKDWAKTNFGSVEASMADLLSSIKEIDSKEGLAPLSDDEISLRHNLKEKFICKAKEEKIKWRQRSRLSRLKEGDKNAKFFHSFASYRNRVNKISILLDGDRRLETKEEIVDHVIAFYTDLFSKEDWDGQPTLDNLEFPTICAADADGLEKDLKRRSKRQFLILGERKRLAAFIILASH